MGKYKTSYAATMEPVALFVRALLVEQTDHIAAPAHIKPNFIITYKNLILSTEETEPSPFAE